MLNFKNIHAVPTVRTVGMSILFTLFLSYLIYKELPSFQSILLSSLIIIISAYIWAYYYYKPEIKNHFILGAVSYLVYSLGFVFFKLSESKFSLTEEIISALIFGGLTGLSYWYLYIRK